MRKMLIAIAIAAALTGTAASARPPPWTQQGFASADACFKYADAHTWICAQPFASIQKWRKPIAAKPIEPTWQTP